ncbi:hypothetical protein [Paenibacillus eucommiae]|uniref:Uncharacterized protein n=1 Tax=Paenibacillus eucommiae TaxID=1355755 RepID=A0ABS4J281_9BACL|nr:hypothetical protein [Paenibacillus eucommiae]MBP1993361.1 hypothetical protein [Paenibacillus eucommiae]
MDLRPVIEQTNQYYEEDQLLMIGQCLRFWPAYEYLKEVVEISSDMGYYREIKYFAEHVAKRSPMLIATPESTMLTIALIEKEILSANEQGKWIDDQRLLARYYETAKRLVDYFIFTPLRMIFGEMCTEKIKYFLSA